MQHTNTIFLAVALLCTASASAQSQSGDWSRSYAFPSNGSSRQLQGLTQADLIAKREAGYYDGLGKNTVNQYSISSYSVGSLNESTSTVNVSGDGNAVQVGIESNNSGALDASVEIIDINRSTLGQRIRAEVQP